MGIRAGIVECPHCGNHLQDTKQEYINCRFCGKSFKRGTVAKDKEEAMRRTMILDLSDEIQKLKAISLVGKMFGALFLVLGIVWLFAEAWGVIEIFLTVAFLVCGGIWMGLAVSYGSKFDKKQSKLFDLTGGREVFEY